MKINDNISTVFTRMICTFMLTVLVIYLPDVEATIGTSCNGDKDCVMTNEACSLLGLCQCKAGYKIHIYPSNCNTVSARGGSCLNISECHACKPTIAFGTCACHPAFHEYQGSCYLSSKLLVGQGCYSDDECRDEHARCNGDPPSCRCMDGYYEYLEYCIHSSVQCFPIYTNVICLENFPMCRTSRDMCFCRAEFYEYQRSCHFKGNHNETCYTAEGCRNDMNLVCSNSSGGICVCETGYYCHHYHGCTEKLLVGQGCDSDDECRDEHARCNGDPPSCRCMDGYYVNQSNCIQKAYLGEICQNHDGCTGEGVVCNSLYNGTCVCNSTYIPYQENCYHLPDPPKNLLVLNVTSRSFTITLEKPNEVFGELLGYDLKITLGSTGRCLIENLIRCASGCVDSFTNQAALSTCPHIIQYQCEKTDLVMIKHNVNTLDPGTVYWVSVAAVSQYGKGFTADLNVTTLHEDDVKVDRDSEYNSMTTVIIVSIACGTLIVITLTVAATVTIKRKRASESKNEADTGSSYMDFVSKTNENHYDTIAATSIY